MSKPMKSGLWYFCCVVVLTFMVGTALWRGLFIFHNQPDDVFLPFIKGVRLDLSVACGVILLAILPIAGGYITGWKVFDKIAKGWIVLAWIFISIVELSSVLLYKEWGTTLDSRALSYLKHPSEAWSSVKDFLPLLVILMGLVISFGIGAVIVRLLKRYQSPLQRGDVKSWMLWLLVGVLAFLGLRGGWQKLPIKPSDAFYSTDMKNNFAATGKVWYFLYSVKKSGKIEIVCPEDIIAAFSDKYRETRCVNSEKDGQWADKNIYLIVMEGWSADMVEYLDGKEKIAPFFDSLSRHSIRLNTAFSTGFRTDQGLASLLCGVPSIQSINIPNTLDKVIHLPSLVEQLKVGGRKSSFVYGGDLNFSNLYNFLVNLGFDTIVGQQDFDRKGRLTDWGVPDHIAAEKSIKVTHEMTSPFFSTWLMLSSHAPFDVPIKNEYSEAQDIPGRYKSSVRYSDDALKLFFDKASKEAWFENTVFILTSDHGSTHSEWAGMEDHNRFRIPMLIYVPYDSLLQPINIDKAINHFDLPLTITQMTGMDSSPFIFGRNVFCEDDHPLAYWNTDQVVAGYNSDFDEIRSTKCDATMPDESPVLFFDMVKLWFNSL